MCSCCPSVLNNNNNLQRTSTNSCPSGWGNRPPVRQQTVACDNRVNGLLIDKQACLECGGIAFHNPSCPSILRPGQGPLTVTAHVSSAAANPQSSVGSSPMQCMHAWLYSAVVSSASRPSCCCTEVPVSAPDFSDGGMAGIVINTEAHASCCCASGARAALSSKG